jgi:hypothetical protein
MAAGDDILRERINEREQILMQQSDSLDVKASILLVAVTFLAGHSMYLLTGNHSGFILWDQRVSVVLQIVAGITLALHLRIRSYQGEKTQDYPEWRDQVTNHFGKDQTEQIESELNKGIITRALERLAEAEWINNSKAKHIARAYWITLIAFCCNLIALVALVLR